LKYYRLAAHATDAAAASWGAEGPAGSPACGVGAFKSSSFRCDSRSSLAAWLRCEKFRAQNDHLFCAQLAQYYS
jgi:hypothetical protein